MINHVPKLIRDGASKAIKTFKDKIVGLYNRVTGSTANQAQETQRSAEPKPFKPIELEQAFRGAYKAIGLMEDPRQMLICSLIE